MTPAEEDARNFLCLTDTTCPPLLDPHTIRKIFKLLMKAHWADSRNHGRYASELCDSANVTVLLSYELDDKNLDPIPSVKVKTRATKLDKKTLNNYSGVTKDYQKETTGTIVETLVVFEHMFQDAEQALIAAQSTAEFLLGVRELLMKAFKFSMIELVEIGDLQLTDPRPERYYRVDVSLKLNYNIAITVNLESHLIKTVETSLEPQ